MQTLHKCRTKAQELFTNLIQDFNDQTNYWQVGCVFDTLTDYLQQDASFQNPKVPASQVDDLMKGTYAQYQQILQSRPPAPYCWYDDFGWWGLACSKAFWPSFANVFRGQARYYQKIALTTWEIMKNGKCDGIHYGAPNAWSICDQDTFAICEPRFPGGVWQYDIFAAKRELDNSPSNPSTPIDLPGGISAANLGPFQQTVVNGLYFVLANRMCAAGYESPEAAKLIFGFFNSWFHDRSLHKHHRLNQIVPGGQLILERVSTYHNKSHRVHGWDSKTAWGGDQGLVFGALAEYKRDHAGPAWIDDMLNAVMGGVAGSMSKPGSYMLPWRGRRLEQIDAGDYSSGVGVYMRHLNSVYGFDSAVRTALDASQNPMRELVLRSSETVCANQFPTWGNNTLFGTFNQLAVLVMAISLLREE